MIEPSPEATVDPLDAVSRSLAEGDHRAAWASMVHFLGLHPTSASCQAVETFAEQLDPKRADLVALRVAFLGNVTMDLLGPLHVARGLASRLLVQPYVAGFDTWAQELLDPAAPLHEFGPQVVVLVLRLEALAPALATRFLDLDAAGIQAEIDAVVERVGSALQAWRTRSTAKVLLHSAPLPLNRSLGVADDVHPRGQTAAIRALNARLGTLAGELHDVYLVDVDALVARIGWTRWHDPRMDALAKLPYTPAALHAMTDYHLRYLRAFAGLVRKVLVLDLDNTLWGGIVGEDGPEGLQLGPTYPGSAYRDLQQVILQLHRRGVVLAINSHNNEADALEVLSGHAGMVLRPEHFAAIRINWQDKAANMMELSDELGLGVDSFVFLEDSDAQCERIRQALPEVLVVPQKGEVASRADVLAGLGVFDSLGYSEEDRQRGALYRTEAERSRLKRAAPSLEEYLRSLEMTLTVDPITPQNIARVADLTQRTNQFNLTTPRHSRDSLAAFLSGPDREGYAFRLADRFGDYGLIGTTLLDHDGDTAVVDTLLMSCRVLKRSVEDAILGFLVSRARAGGRRRLRGLYRPTRKNGQVAEFFPARGFTETERREDETVVFELTDLGRAGLPDWIRILGPD